MNKIAGADFFEALEVRKHKLKICFLNGVSSFIVGASFNRNNVYNSTCKVYLRKTTEVHCGLGDCSEDKIYENAINSLQKD